MVITFAITGAKAKPIKLLYLAICMAANIDCKDIAKILNDIIFIDSDVSFILSSEKPGNISLDIGYENINKSILKIKDKRSTNRNVFIMKYLSRLSSCSFSVL